MKYYTGLEWLRPAVALQARLHIAELRLRRAIVALGHVKALAQRHGVGPFGDCRSGEAFRRRSEEGCVAARAQCTAESKERPGEDLFVCLFVCFTVFQ